MPSNAPNKRVKILLRKLLAVPKELCDKKKPLKISAFVHMPASKRAYLLRFDQCHHEKRDCDAARDDRRRLSSVRGKCVTCPHATRAEALRPHSSNCAPDGTARWLVHLRTSNNLISEVVACLDKRFGLYFPATPACADTCLTTTLIAIAN